MRDGTGGRSAACRGIEFCGKTGTAQVVEPGLSAPPETIASRRTTRGSWVSRRAAIPRSVVAVLVQGRQATARIRRRPIARDVVKAYYDKKHGKLPAAVITSATTSSAASAAPTVSDAMKTSRAPTRRRAINAAVSVGAQPSRRSR